MKAPLLPDEVERLTALRRDEILDMKPGQEFDGISQHARAREVLRSVSSREQGAHRKKVFRDLAIIVALTALVFTVGHVYDVFDPIFLYFAVVNNHLNSALDEVFASIVFFGLAMMVFSYRRFRESRSETLTQTQISNSLKILHADMEAQVRQRTAELVQTNDNLRDEIAERKRTEAARDRLVAILEVTTDTVSIADPSGYLLYLNTAGRNLLGVGLDEDISRVALADLLSAPATHPVLTEGIPAAIRRGTWTGENSLLSRSGREIAVSQVILAHNNPAGDLEFLSMIMRDITEHRRLEAQLFQSQKLETVGKLAGGVAHEFNSILTAIIGQSELLLNDLPPDSPLIHQATEIGNAAGRAATLTRQLLAYGRKQFLQPKPVDLNQVIASMEGMLRHLMSGDVDLRIVPSDNLQAVMADAGQIEQVIMNIVINARDAMPNGGRLVMETANVSFDADSVGRYPELKPGDYVMLAISDTGAGMSPEVRNHAFDPFSSTKGVGEGTGMGLSTCYGIIKQSGGHISVYSEPGRGATFKIYLPQVEFQRAIPVNPLDSPGLPRGTETILLVEDDPSLREMATTLLRRLGYTVLTAADGIEALNLKQQRDIGHIDLLFTDVVMPHMSGKELSDRIRAAYPHTRILFTSAYTENAVIHQGVMENGVQLLQKPFTPSALARKLRQVLDQPKSPSANIAPKRVDTPDALMLARDP